MTDPAEIKSPPRFVPFGKYLLLERVAIGGMAEVYLAKTFEDGQASDLLAVKRIRTSLAEDGDFIRMFLDEAKIAGQLDHPGIVAIRELGRVGASHYLAMDFVWGKDLLHIIRRCRLLGAQLSPSFVAWVGASMCEALHYAHERTDRHGEPMHLIHRDVSPQNVLVSFDGRVKLIDFGIAKAQSRTTRTQAGVLKGKVGYMSPEQVSGKKMDRRSDLFAVGTCLYELLTLKSLFARENNFDAMENVRHVRARPIRELRPDVPPELERILQRTLTQDPDERWPNAREMQYALISFINIADPGYDRVSAVAWLRDAFRKELGIERLRLAAFDQVGRPQVAPAEGRQRTSITDLEIPEGAGASVPDLDDEDTLAFSSPAGLLDGAPTDTPSEVFFRSGEIPAWRESGRHALKSDSASGEDRAPQPIDSALIKSLLPVDDEASTFDESPSAAQEPTARRSAVRRGREAPTNPWPMRVVLALGMLAAGAAGTYLWSALGGEATIEVRTVPDVSATVLVDGAPRGQAPLRIGGLAPGQHVVTFVADGYQDVQRELTLDRNGVAMVEVALEPRAPDPD